MMPTSRSDPRIYRLLDAIAILRRSAGIHTDDLARELEVSPRTVQRDLNVLRGYAGFELVDPIPGRHRLIEDWK